MTNVPWPKELVERLHMMWLEGRSAKDIGEELGKTKNAVIGRMTRMRNETNDQSLLRKQPVDHTRPKHVPKKAFNKIAEGLADALTVAKGNKPVRGKLWMPPPPIGETACRLEYLTLRTCRWPVGEATGEHQLFCGLPEASLEDNRPYCEGHNQVAYQPLRGTDEHHNSDRRDYRFTPWPRSKTRHFGI